MGIVTHNLTVTKVRLPNYLIIGMQRCGTTSLYMYLCSHPDWHGMSLGDRQGEPSAGDEIHFFDYDRLYAQELDWYLARMKHDDGVVGEQSPTYLHSKRALRRIAHTLPDARFIVLLRDPVKRAFSHYWKARNVGYETLPTFEKALAAEADRLATCTSADFENSARHLYAYRERGVYWRHLERWLEVFPPSKFIILQSERFYQRPIMAVTYIWHQFGLEYPSKMRTPRMRYQGADYGSELQSDTARELYEFYAPHNERLMRLLSRLWRQDLRGTRFDAELWYNGDNE